MATIVYLDAEDEITSAASRIRAAADSRVGLVIPFGSRVATSRINFRLLAREAMSHGRRLDIVAPDASARALAASAGLPVFASVGEYEEALDEDDAQAAARRAEARAAAGITGAAAVASEPSGRRAPALGRAAGHGRSGGATAGVRRRGLGCRSRRTRRRRSRAPRRRMLQARLPGSGSGRRRTDGQGSADRGAIDDAIDDLGGAAIPQGRPRRCRSPTVGAAAGPSASPSASWPSSSLAGGVAAFAGYLLLPHAAITLTPHVETVGPVTFWSARTRAPRPSTRTPP